MGSRNLGSQSAAAAGLRGQQVSGYRPRGWLLFPPASSYSQQLTSPAYGFCFLTESSAHGFHSGPRFTAFSLVVLLSDRLKGFDLPPSRLGETSRAHRGCWPPVEDFLGQASALCPLAVGSSRLMGTEREGAPCMVGTSMSMSSAQDRAGWPQ